MPWVAGSEPALLREMPGWLCTNLPERYGVDFLWRAKGSYCGAQRKELGDLLASVSDGRLAKEVQQMQMLMTKFLIIEGWPKWTDEGMMIGQYGRAWSATQWRSMLRGVSAMGVVVEQSSCLETTRTLIEDLVSWTRKEHRSLTRRPRPVSSWGKADNRDYQLHLVQGLPGVGPELAERIVDRFGVPFGWRVTREELAGVQGLGSKKIKAMWEALA
jgi:DNA excision repair protein ERCC-4